jgi:hypothetical protein
MLAEGICMRERERERMDFFRELIKTTNSVAFN